MKKKAQVVIHRGKHNHPVPKGMKEVIEEMLEKAGIREEDFNVQFGARIRGHEKCKPVQVCSLDKNTKGILLKVQPSSKDSRHECVIYVPGSFRDRPETFFELLVGATTIDAPTTQDNTTASQGENTMTTTRRPTANCIFKDAELLHTTFGCIAETLFTNNNSARKKDVLSELKKLGLKCSEIGAFEFFELKGYLSTQRENRRVSHVSLTQEGRKLMNEISGECTPPTPITAPIDNLVNEFQHRKEAFELYQKVSSLLEVIRKEKEELIEKLQKLQLQEKELQEVQTSNSVAAEEYRQIKEILH